MTNGLVVMTPTSISVTGPGAETATINADGSIAFVNAFVVSLNGIFTGDHDNYMISLRYNDGIGHVYFRLRNSGSDESGTNYTIQYSDFNNTTLNKARTSASTYGYIGYCATSNGGDASYLFKPYLAQPTAVRTVNVNAFNSARLTDQVSMHSLSTSYDGHSFGSFSSGEFSGLVTVFGFNQ